MSKRPGEPYSQLIEPAAADPLRCLVKLADNARNLESNDELARADPETAARLREKYQWDRKRPLG